MLDERCNLRRGTRTFEIGAGTGLATRHLLRLGANPLLIVEPDNRLADYLKTSLGAQLDRVEIGIASLEDRILPFAEFDLGVCRYRLSLGR